MIFFIALINRRFALRRGGGRASSFYFCFIYLKRRGRVKRIKAAPPPVSSRWVCDKRGGGRGGFSPPTLMESEQSPFRLSRLDKGNSAGHLLLCGLCRFFLGAALHSLLVGQLTLPQIFLDLLLPLLLLALRQEQRLLYGPFLAVAGRAVQLRLRSRRRQTRRPQCRVPASEAFLDKRAAVYLAGCWAVAQGAGTPGQIQRQGYLRFDVGLGAASVVVP